MHKWKNSIFYTLTYAYLGLGLLPLCIAGLLFYLQFSRNMKEVMLDDMSHVVSYAAHNVEEMVEECNTATKLIYDIPLEDGRFLWQLLKDPKTTEARKKLLIQSLLKEILARDSRIASVFFVEESGEVYYATANPQKVLQTDKQKMYRESEHTVVRKLSLYPTHLDDYFPQSTNTVLTFARPYQDVSSLQNINQTLGKVYLDVSLTKLSSVLQEVDVTQSGVFRLLTETGACIYSTNPHETGSQLARESLSKKGEYLVYEQIPNCNWVAALSVPKATMLGNLSQTRQSILIFVSTAFLILIFLYRFFLQKIKRPVEELEQGMKEIRTGNLQVRIPVNRKDELGHLAEGLNHMAEELNTHIHKVYVAEIRQREAELDALKSQIKPHYLYNTLDVIRMMALENDEKDGWHHVGLKNAYDRIQKNFGKDYGIEIISTEGIGTIVNLSFPIIDAEDSIF
ncbi:MAG: HAMP domain-containing protein [bacterium]|nr:HAMP domain-containing protein [bacterium]